MGMSNFTFKESPLYADCVPGVWTAGIADMKMSDDRKYIEISVGPCEKEAKWNRMPFRKRIYDGDSFDGQWSKFCECFGFTAQNAPNPLGDYRAFVGKRGKVKFSFEKREQQADGSWANVPSDYMQVVFLSPKSKLEIGPLQSAPLPFSSAQAPKTQAQSQGFETSYPAPDPTPPGAGSTQGGSLTAFPEDIPF